MKITQKNMNNFWTNSQQGCIQIIILVRKTLNTWHGTCLILGVNRCCVFRPAYKWFAQHLQLKITFLGSLTSFSIKKKKYVKTFKNIKIRQKGVNLSSLHWHILLLFYAFFVQGSKIDIGLKHVVRMVTSIPSIRYIGVKTTDTSTSLTLSNTKRGTDLDMLVVPFDQTFHPLHTLEMKLLFYFLMSYNFLTKGDPLFEQHVMENSAVRKLCRNFRGFYFWTGPASAWCYAFHCKRIRKASSNITIFF